jgi:hypothetical protein
LLADAGAVTFLDSPAAEFAAPFFGEASLGVERTPNTQEML